MVAKLFKVNDSKNSLALLMAAGDALHYYVTDDDVTSRMIIEHGQLQRRVTIMPINKMQWNPINRTIIDFAQSLVGKENAILALSAIDYDPHIDPVMKSIFGNTIICPSIEIATQVAFHPNINCRCVTLHGYIVDPDGLCYTGHSASNILQDIAILKSKEIQMKEYLNELQHLKKELDSLENLSSTYSKFYKRLESHRMDLDICVRRLAQTQEHLTAIATLKESVQTIENKVRKAQKTQASEIVKIKEIEAKLIDIDGYKTEAMQAAEQIDEKLCNHLNKAEQRYDILQLDIENVLNGLESTSKQDNELSECLMKQETELYQFLPSDAHSTKKIVELKQTIKEKKLEIISKPKEIRALTFKKVNLQKEIRELGLEIKKKNDYNSAEKEMFLKIDKIKRVNKNFLNILRILLQSDDETGLCPVLQDDHLLSLETIDGFNGIWKDLLGELSGGQQTLVSISLLFALFKLSPAPIYILDDVDSDLDELRTNKIINMLKEHFPSSQFIIVSLNDFLINNVNVIFRTNVEDDVSTVTRSVNNNK